MKTFHHINYFLYVSIVVIISNFFSFPGFAAESHDRWTTDTVLNDGYQMTTVYQPDDYSGKVRSTVIRRNVSLEHPLRGVLYVHGFNDYFLQYEMGEKFNENGYAFYAVDLRKYGRSLTQGQKMCQVRKISEYYPDIDSALTIMRNDGIEEIVIMGHSTGGLTVSSYMSTLDKDKSNRTGDIRAVILNSPFLDWNLGKLECFVPAIAFLGKFFPNITVHQGGSAYSESLLKSYHGEWSYNTDWKRFNSTDVDLGWIRAINQAQHSLRGGKADITQPILLLYSSNSVNGKSWNEAYNHGDGVLDVKDIRKYGLELGPDVTAMKVNGGLHDLLLSETKVREAVYDAIFKWLKQTLALTNVEE